MIERSAAGKNGKARLTFILDNEDRAVSVVGTFNEWDPHAHPLRRRADGTRRASVTVPVGEVVCFRYLADDGEWFDDSDIDAYDHRGGLIRTAHLAIPGQAGGRTKRGTTARGTTAKTATKAKKTVGAAKKPAGKATAKATTKAGAKSGAKAASKSRTTAASRSRSTTTAKTRSTAARKPTAKRTASRTPAMAGR